MSSGQDIHTSVEPSIHVHESTSRTEDVRDITTDLTQGTDYVKTVVHITADLAEMRKAI